MMYGNIRSVELSVIEHFRIHQKTAASSVGDIRHFFPSPQLTTLLVAKSKLFLGFDLKVEVYFVCKYFLYAF